MTCNCNTPTFVMQTGLVRTLTPESGQLASITGGQVQYQLRLSDSCCCGVDDATLIDINELVYDGTFFYDGAVFYQGTV